MDIRRSYPTKVLDHTQRGSEVQELGQTQVLNWGCIDTIGSIGRKRSCLPRALDAALDGFGAGTSLDRGSQPPLKLAHKIVEEDPD